MRRDVSDPPRDDYLRDETIPIQTYKHIYYNNNGKPVYFLLNCDLDIILYAFTTILKQSQEIQPYINNI